MFGNTQDRADVCLFLEGTYPYVSGGVSSWTHELLQVQSDKTFHLVSVVPRDLDLTPCFEMPNNVISHSVVVLQELPPGAKKLSKHQEKKLFNTIEMPLLTIPLPQIDGKHKLQELGKIIDVLKSVKVPLGSEILMNSEAAFRMLVRMYNETMGDSRFLDYFWSWRALFGGLYSVLLADLPNASTYHTLCTGYSGLFLARAHLETGRPCIITEHGIYTNERRIEIIAADWLHDEKALNFNISDTDVANRDIREYWVDTFTGYSNLCYEATDQIITLFEGNRSFQIADGAKEEVMRIIPNGVDIEHFSSIVRGEGHPPTIALIGRVVPIKDIKTFIRTVAQVKDNMPEVRVFIMGSHEEDPHYYEECQEMVVHFNLEDNITFMGHVKIDEYMNEIDVLVLTSISEAQPLVILEAGAAGIPAVATDVGACHELILGKADEKPKLGPGGGVSPLASARALAHEIILLLRDKDHYARCSQAMQERVKTYYDKKDQHRAYAELYSTLAAQSHHHEEG